MCWAYFTRLASASNRDALACLKIPKELGTWQVRSTTSDKDLSAGKFIPPKSPVNASEDLQSELKWLRAERNNTLTAAQRYDEENQAALSAAETVETRHLRESAEWKT